MSEFFPDEQDKIREAFCILKARCHALAVEKGWHDPPRSVPEALALIHSEISEALEEYRCDDAPVNEIRVGRPVFGFPVELADAVIRIFDLCGALHIDLADALLQKHAYNSTRPHRHGGKRC